VETIKDMTILDRISSSAFFNDFRVRRSDDKRLIVRTFNLSTFDSEKRIFILNEFRKMKLIKLDGLLDVISVDISHDKLTLIFEDFNGIALSDVLTKKETLNITHSLDIAICISHCLFDIYNRGIIVYSMLPQNILIDPEKHICKIVAFGGELIQKHSQKAIADINVITNILPYISPEQTGRINQKIDHRSDLYSFGIILYQLFTGKLPFESDDALELMHCHIAKDPLDPDKINQKIPGPISKIILKLISKSPDDRYQSVKGLIYDLEICAELLKKGKIDKSFQLGANDIRLGEFQINSGIIGRESEKKQLRATFSETLRGKSRFVFVAGKAGSGKSTFVDSIQEEVMNSGGYYLTGKFEKFMIDKPYSAIIQSLNSLFMQIMMRGEEENSTWKQIFLHELGSNASIIADVIPRFSDIVGKQPAPIEVSSFEGRNRFQLSFKKLLDALIKADKPIVFFFDDIHWADSTSIDAIKNLVIDHLNSKLMIICAYREEEIDSSTEHLRFIRHLQTTNPVEIQINPLKKEDINDMVIIALRSDSEGSGILSELIYKKTGGNPFFAKQFLKILFEKRYIFFEGKKGWNLKLEEIKKLPITENVVDIILDLIKNLPELTKSILQSAACYGHEFSLKPISRLHKISVEKAKTALFPAITQEIITMQDSRFSFSHDRIHEAIYSSIKKQNRMKLHYQIGKIMLDETKGKKHIEEIFNVTNQLTRGTKPIIQHERHEYAKTYFLAGKNAKMASAYAEARKYFRECINFLPTDCWESEYEFSQTTYSELAESEFINNNPKEGERIFNMIEKNVKDTLDLANVHHRKINIYTHENRFKDAICLGINSAGLLGVKLSQKPNRFYAILQILLLKHKYRNKPIEYFNNLPTLKEKRVILVENLLTDLLYPSYQIDINLYQIIIVVLFKLIIKHGNTGISPPIYNAYATILVGAFSRYRQGYDFGKLSLDLMKRTNDQNKSGLVYMQDGAFLTRWGERLIDAKRYLDQAIDLSIKMGDFATATSSIGFRFFFAYLVCQTLEELSEECEKDIKLQNQMNDITIIHGTMCGREFALRFMETEQDEHHYEANDEIFKESFADDIPPIKTFIHLARNTHNYLLGNLERALSHAEECDKIVRANFAAAIIQEHNFLYALSLLGITKNNQSDRRNIKSSKIKKLIKKHKQWADIAPQNYLHQYLLMCAEFARVRNENDDAKKLYPLAVSEAINNEFVRDSAIAKECAGEYFLSIGEIEQGREYIIDAYDTYTRWGAKLKAKQMTETYPAFLSEIGIDQKNKMSTLDLNSIIQASQSISMVLELPKLLDKLIRLVVESSGAQKAFLITFDNQIPKVSAHYDSSTDNILTTMSPLETHSMDLCIPIVNLVRRMKTDIILENASQNGDYTKDEYVMKAQPKSLLCSPILRQNNLQAILYIENNELTNAFKPEIIGLLKTLCSQAAISLENVHLYANLKKEIDFRKRSETKVKNILNQKTDFINHVGHDLRTPLTPIINLLPTLKKHVAKNKDASQALEIIIKNTDTLNNILKEMFMFLNLQSGFTVFDMKPEDIEKIISDVVAICSESAAEKKVKLINKIKGPIPKVNLDIMQIEDVLKRLITNGISFTNRGGSVAVSIKVNSDKIIVAIEDTGIGIAKNNLEKIFNEFYKTDYARHEHTSGLGLTICRKVINAHGGKIWAESEGDQKGTMIKFELPVVKIKE